MNTGAEAMDTAMKIARKWAYINKGISFDKAIFISAKNCFHGRTLGAMSLSHNPENKFFGPSLSGLYQVEFDSISELENMLEKYGHITAAIVLEPIQEEGGVQIPQDGYLSAAADLCKKHNVLLIDDECQTAIGRTGKTIAAEWDNVKPDILVLGKALSGGVYPVSAVLADRRIMDVIQPGDHGSTYGGNPLACVVAMAALQVVKDEDLNNRSIIMGERFREALQEDVQKYDFVKSVRGKGLLNALEIETGHSKTASDLSKILQRNGILAKGTQKYTLRFTPPLTITDEEMTEALHMIKKSLSEMAEEQHDTMKLN